VPTSAVTLFKTNEAGPINELSLRAYAWSHFTLSAVEIKPRAHFNIVLNATADLRTVFALAYDLGQLMTMLIGEPSYVKKLTLFDQTDASVDVFFPSTIRTEKELHSPMMCFPLRDVHTIVQTLAEKWFDSLSLMEPVYDLLFGTLFGRDSFVRTKFLNLTQALEAFHRRVRGGTYTCPSEYSAIQDALDASAPVAIQEAVKPATPADVRESLRRRISDSLKYANEYSLRKRLKELLYGLDRSTVEMLKTSDVAATADLIVKTRHYLTHFDEQSRTKLVDDIVGMHYMNERLTALLFILILKRLGMDETTAARGALKRRYIQ